MLYLLTAGDPTGSHDVFTVEGPAGLDLDALWSAFNGPINEYLGDAPDVTERSRWRAWHDARDRYLADCHKGMTGRDAPPDTFMLTDLFAVWLCRHHGCRPAETTRFGTEA